MDEARRFLRYVLPGLAFFTQLGIALLIIDSSQLIELFESITRVSGLLPVLGGFLVSGALGYIFSTFYFSIRWGLAKYTNLSWGILDHASLINKLKNTDKLKLKDVTDGIYCENKNITQSDAWNIITFYWFWNKEGFNENLNKKTVTFADTVHGLGAATIGTFFAFVVWGYLHYFEFGKYVSGFSCIEFGYFIIWGGLFLIQLFNYNNTLKQFQSLVNTAIANRVYKEGNGEDNKVIFFFSE